MTPCRARGGNQPRGGLGPRPGRPPGPPGLPPPPGRGPRFCGGPERRGPPVPASPRGAPLPRAAARAGAAVLRRTGTAWTLGARVAAWRRIARLRGLAWRDRIAFLQQPGERRPHAGGEAGLHLLRQIGEGDVGVKRTELAD